MRKHDKRFGERRGVRAKTRQHGPTVRVRVQARQSKRRIEEAMKFGTCMFNTVREPLLMLDAELRVLMANRAFYQFFQTGEEETVGQLLFNLGEGQWEIPALRELLQDILPRDSHFDNFEVRHRFGKIGQRTLLLNARRIFQDGPEILLALEDVTERQRLEQTLQASETRYRRLFESAQDGILILNGDTGKIFDANPQVQSILGYEYSELVGKEMWELGLINDISANQSMFRELLDKGAVRYEDLPVRTKGGRSIAAEFVCSRYQVDDRKTIQCNVRDVSLRKQAEEALRRSEGLFRGLAEGIPQLVWTCTADCKSDFLSRQWSDYTGLPVAQLLGAGWREVVHPEDREPTCALWTAAGQRGETKVDLECRLRQSDGQYRWFKLMALPIFDANGVVERWFGTCTDIQEQKETEAGLIRSRQQVSNHANELEKEVGERTAALQTTVSDLDAFSYSVSHDLRSPLRAMQGYAQALLEEYAERLDERGQTFLTRMDRAAGRLDQLVQDILVYSRIARADLPLGPVNLESLCDEIIGQYPEFQLPLAEIALERPLLAVVGHAGALTQCISNLLSNAVKFVAPGVQPRIRIWTDAVGGNVRFCIQDNGIGIAPVHFERIFQIYGRVHPDDQFEGTGIGLAIVKKAVERMRGTLGVDSQLGEGSRFWIGLPRA